MSPIKNASWEEISRIVDLAETFLVASHVRPDADALGSTLAVTLWLKSLGKNVTAWNEEGMLDKFRYLPCHELVSKPDLDNPRHFDVIFALDNSVKNRLGNVWSGIAGTGCLINIDHHVSNEGYGDMNYIDPSSPATGQILYRLFRQADIPITSEMATNLFAAISTDTGSFQYPGTNGETFLAAAALVEAGVNVGELSKAMYENQPRRRFNLLQHALTTVEFSCDDQIASFCLTESDAHRLGVLPEDNEGIIDHLRSVDHVVAAVFFEELGEGKIRVSARSKNLRVDVCKVCREFGGGGHPLASGARMTGSLAAVKEKFLAVLCNEIRRLA